MDARLAAYARYCFDLLEKACVSLYTLKEAAKFVQTENKTVASTSASGLISSSNQRRTVSHELSKSFESNMHKKNAVSNRVDSGMAEKN